MVKKLIKDKIMKQEIREETEVKDFQLDILNKQSYFESLMNDEEKKEDYFKQFNSKLELRDEEGNFIQTVYDPKVNLIFYTDNKNSNINFGIIVSKDEDDNYFATLINVNEDVLKISNFDKLYFNDIFCNHCGFVIKKSSIIERGFKGHSIQCPTCFKNTEL